MEKDKNPNPNYQFNQTPVEPEPAEKAPARILIRVLILGAVLIVLIALSIGIIKLVPKALSSLASVNVSISSLFTPSKTATSSVSISTQPASNAPSTQNNNPANNSGQATTSAPYPASGSNNSGSNSNNYPAAGGTPDLEVKITSVGTLDRNTNAFTPTTNVNTNDRFAVEFQIQNVGNGPSGTWNLQAALPAVNPGDQTKSLYNQRSIPAGMAVSGTLYFDYVQTGQNRLVQIVISDNKPEAQTGNNTAQININATGSNNNGYGGGIVTNGVDLAVRVLDTGIVDRNSGQYSATNYVRSSDKAGVRFQVTNQGSAASGNWSFSVNVPQNGNNNNNCYYNNGYYACANNNSGNNAINQSNQVSMAPGESRIYIVGFDGLQYGNNTVSINLDPYNQVSDNNRGNNYASANISVNSY